MRVAIIHDWLVAMRGGERVLEAICELYPQADLYTLIHIEESVSPAINRMKIKTSFVQNLPFARKHFRVYLPFFPLAIEKIDLRGYDVVISSSHCVAKGVITSPGTYHICYCHTPMRYAWAMYDEYCARENMNRLSRKLFSSILSRLRSWDLATLPRVDYFLAPSKYIVERIKKYYDREAAAIYPSIYDSDSYKMDLSTSKEDEYFLVVSALVPYKKVDIAVGAFNELKIPLKIVGEGPLSSRLRKRSKPNIEFLGRVSDAQLKDLYRNCRALIFPGEEDFGLVPIEAQLWGKPVIAYGRGGVLETVIDKETGLFFHEQNHEDLVKAIGEFKEMVFERQKIRENALRFCDREKFKEKLTFFIKSKYTLHKNNDK